VEKVSWQTSRKGAFLSALGGWKATAPCYVASGFVIRVSVVIRHSDFVIVLVARLLFLPRAYFTRSLHIMPSSIILPERLPVMPLPSALLFPHALLPLYIFEFRYRQMLKYALAHHRMFCIALIKPGCADWQSTADFFHTAGVGLIRACVERGDGTSNLILQGLERVRFRDFEQETSFPIATIDSLESDSASSVETEALAAKVLELYSSLKGDGQRQLPPKVDRYLSDLSDPEMLADLVASTFVSDPLHRQRIMEELSTNRRLRLLIQYLREENGGAAA
jgi:Lon protease-like protein